MVANKLDQQKRQHRERAQPLKRQRLGLLEKHADYVKRARDFHSKEDRIKKLREKAAGRNKDELYFGMIRSRTQKGVHVQSRGNEVLPDDLVKVLKTQDVGYIRTQRAMEESRVRRLEEQLHMIIDPATLKSKLKSKEEGEPLELDEDDWDAFDLPPPQASTSSSTAISRKTIFTDDLKTVRTISDPSTLVKKPRRALPHLDSSQTKRSKKGKAKSNIAAALQDPAVLEKEELERISEAEKHRKILQGELEARQGRLAAFSRAMRELELQRLLMGKGSKKALVPKKKPKDGYGGGDDDENWGDIPERIGGVPEALEDGITTGARVWKWKAQRHR